MALTYIDPASPPQPTAAIMNDLYGELDAKLAVLFDGKDPWLAWGAEAGGIFNPVGGGFNGVDFNARPIGKRFYFCNGATPYIGALCTPFGNWTAWPAYSHAGFQTAVNAASVNFLDAQRGLLNITLGGTTWPSNSLAVHKKTYAGNDWPVVDTSKSREPERVSAWGVAEIILEGTGLSPFAFDEAWNKYNFLRFHNWTNAAITVNIGTGPRHSISVPAFGVRCVRRTAVAGVYENGFNYFFKFQAGDPISWACRPITDDPAGAMRGNNILNAGWHVNYWADIAKAGWKRNAMFPGTTGQRNWVFKAIEDPAETWDAGGLEKGNFDALDATTGAPVDAKLAADLFVRKGVLHVIDKTTGAKTELALTKCDDFAGLGFTVAKAIPGGTVFPSGLTKITLANKDVVAFGTNLFRDATGKVARDVSAGTFLGLGQRQIQYTSPGLATPAPDAPRLANNSGSFNALYKDYLTLANNYVAKNEITVKYNPDASYSPKPIVYHETTVADLKTLAFLSNCNGDPATAVSIYSNVSLKMGPRGPVISFKLNVPYESTCEWSSVGGMGFYPFQPDTYTGPEAFTIDDVNKRLVFARGYRFDWNGWGYDPAGLWTPPRQPRLYGLARRLESLTYMGSIYWLYGNPAIEDQAQECCPARTYRVGVVPFQIGDGSNGPVEAAPTVYAVSVNPPPWSVVASDYGFPICPQPDGLWEYGYKFPSSGWYLANRARLLADGFVPTVYNDWLDVAPRYLEVPLCVEHFNWLAQRVKELKTAHVLNHLAIRVCRQSGATYYTGALLAPGEWTYYNTGTQAGFMTGGLFRSRFKPREQYACWGLWSGTYAADNYHAAFYAFAGITVHGEASLPGAWATLKADTVRPARKFKFQTNCTVNGYNGGTNRTNITINSTALTSTATSLAASSWNNAADLARIFEVAAVTPSDISLYAWVKTADVASHAAAQGFRFDYSELVEPVELVKIPTDGGSVLNQSHTASPFDKVGQVSIWNGSTYVNAVAGNTFSDYWEYEVAAPGWWFIPSASASSDWVKITSWDEGYRGAGIEANRPGFTRARMWKRTNNLDYSTFLVGSGSVITAEDPTVAQTGNGAMDVATGALGPRRCPIVACVALDHGANELAFRSVNYGASVWAHDYTVLGVPARHSCAQNLLVYDYGTPGDRKSCWLKYNAPFVDYRQHFSGESYPKGKSRYNNGFVVVPIDGTVAGPTAVKTNLAADVTLLTPPNDEAFDVVLYFDHSKVI